MVTYTSFQCKMIPLRYSKLPARIMSGDFPLRRRALANLLEQRRRLNSTSNPHSPAIMTTKAAQTLKTPISNFIPVFSRTAGRIQILDYHHGHPSDIKKFRAAAFKAEVPMVLRDANIPKLSYNPHHDNQKKTEEYWKFFERWEGDFLTLKTVAERDREISFLDSQYRRRRVELPHKMLCEKLKKYESAVMQYEYRSGGKPAEQRTKEISFLTSRSRELEFQLPHDIDDSQKEFHRFYAPLQLLFENMDGESGDPIQSLYIAQMRIEELPPEMREMFPPPMDIIECGKGDIYGSSIWIG